MKTITKSILAAFAIATATTVNAGVYPVFYQNYDALTNAANAGFTLTTARGEMSLVERDGNGKAFSYALQANNQTAFYTYWGLDAWAKVEAKDQGVDNYYFTTDFYYAPNNDAKKDGSCLSLISSPEFPSAIKTGWFTPMDTLFHMSTPVGAAPTFVVNASADPKDTLNLVASTWYNLEVLINKETRNVKATITSDEVVVYEKEYSIPEGKGIIPTGLYLSLNKSYSTWMLDNTVAGKKVENDVALDPVAFLTGANNLYREYVISYESGHKLNYKITGDIEMAKASDEESILPTEGTFDFDDVQAGDNDFYFYPAEGAATTAGQLEIWTTFKSVESDHQVIDIDVAEIVLPLPEYKISAVSDGFSKTYAITIDNSEVLTKPNLYFTYKFTDVDRKVTQELDENNNPVSYASGQEITINKAGILEIQAVAPYYTASKKIYIENNQAFKKSTIIDFEHMAEEDLVAKGFEKIDSIQSKTTSGENNWTARLRLYDDIVTGNDTVRYYGPNYVSKRAIVNGAEETITDDWGYPIVRRYEYQKEGAAILANELDSASAMVFAPLMFPNKGTGHSKANTFQVKVGIGLVNNETIMNNVPYYLRGMNEGDFANVYIINNYGGNAAHGYFASIEEAKASNHGQLTYVVPANGSFDLYRIQDAISMIEIMSADKENVADLSGIGTTPVKKIYANAVNDGAIYDLLGRKVDANNMKPGIYIQNGKKFIVK
ncbi:MAG: hypothetical protein K6G73_10485 [Marinilabiliaceae bacterium]|nr:hypothetical protein [Marinilabiliaceae bacterium]